MFDVQQALIGSLQHHGINACIVEQDIVLTENDLSLQIEIFPKESIGHHHLLILELRVFHPFLGSAMIQECFAGMGDSFDDAQSNAFAKMQINLFHLLLEAFTTYQCEQQCLVETWQNHQGQKWQVYFSPLLILGQGEEQLQPKFAQFLEQLKDLFLQSERLNQSFWIRSFIAISKQKLIANEVLLNNEIWEEGQDLAIQYDWDKFEHYGAAREFILCLPIQG